MEAWTPCLTRLQNGHQREWSGYGRYCGERADVAFANGMRASMTLQDNGNTLVWSNGVRWSRDMGWDGDGTWRTKGGEGDLVLLRAYGGGELIKLTNLVDSSESGVGHVSTDGRLRIVFNESGEAVGVVSGEKLTWADGSSWARHLATPPCRCVPDMVEWMAPKPRQEEMCFRIELTEHAYRSSGCETIQVWPGAKGFGFMCDSEGKWDHVGYPTVSVMRLLRENVQPQDRVYLVVGRDFQYAWDVLPCLARSSTARLVDYLVLDSDITVYARGVYGTTKQEEEQTLFRLRQAGVVVMNEEMVAGITQNG
eukprot:GEMP01019680.1.p2 GENE.GEMP01019680.1~~GEMP01019680.1.p2  ORF type:complete len:310 (+),score=87.51 GEMP01019680.1:1479-2408(+)